MPEVLIDSADLGHPAALPVLRAAARLPQVLLSKPAVTMPLRTVLAHQIRGELEQRHLPELIASALADYDRQLQAWRAEALDAMRREFVAAATRVAGRTGGAGSAAEAPSALRDDLERLRRLGAERASVPTPTAALPPGAAGLP